MDYLTALRTNDVRTLRAFSDTGRENLETIFKGLPQPPEYVTDATNVAGWDIRYQKNMNDMLGYFLPLSKMKHNIALLRDGETWMSVTPLEIESHLLAQASAKGNVVVAGLGLGVIAYSLLQKAAVKKLTVLEYDGELIKHFDTILGEDAKQQWNSALASGRLQVIECDCKQPISSATKQAIGRVDYLWVDIWKILGTPEALHDTRFLCKQLKARMCDYWGMELEVISFMEKLALKPKPKEVYKAIEALKLPTSALQFNKTQKKTYADLVIMAATHSAFGAFASNRLA